MADTAEDAFLHLPGRLFEDRGVVQERDFTYITAHFIGHEIDHLARMVRSRHWHRSAAWPVSYWRERIDELQRAPAIEPSQRAGLHALRAELERIAQELEPLPVPRETCGPRESRDLAQ